MNRHAIGRIFGLMPVRSERLLIDIATILFIAGGLFVWTHPEVLFPPRPSSTNTAAAAGGPSEALGTDTPADEAVVMPKAEPENPEPSSPVAKQEPVESAPDEAPSDEATRVKDPYPFPPHSSAITNEEARAALVNILCIPTENALRPITASGVIIDPRGIILTNAHVAQYVLLAGSGRVDLSCTIRTGSPAQSRFEAEVLYLPSVWIEKHAGDIIADHPRGTGEHDYALLRIVRGVDGFPFPTQFPFLPFDSREGIGFVDDEVLAASYPAEFLGGLSAQFNLYAVSTVTVIEELFTFDRGSIDMFSIGGVIGAQSGSSGGPVVNAWGRLIGIITTTSEAKTTGERDLRAIAVSYVSKDMAAQSGASLSEALQGDLGVRAFDFNSIIAPGLVQLLVEQIER